MYLYNCHERLIRECFHCNLIELTLPLSIRRTQNVFFATPGRCTTRTPTPSATPSRTWSPPSPPTVSRPGGSQRTVRNRKRVRKKKIEKRVCLRINETENRCSLWVYWMRSRKACEHSLKLFSCELSSVMTRQEITELLAVANHSRTGRRNVQVCWENRCEDKKQMLSLEHTLDFKVGGKKEVCNETEGISRTPQWDKKQFEITGTSK